jgi:hypothetical protein
MANQQVQESPRYGMGEHEKRAMEVTGAGAMTESIGAAAAIVLSIVGLAGALPGAMMAIAAIVLGAAILLDAAAVSARYRRLVGDAWGSESPRVRAELGGGISAESIAGITGIVLGILALLGLAPLALCTVALIVFGAALIFGSAAKGRFASVSTAHYGIGEKARHVIDEALSLSSSGEVLVGIGAIVLGILALLGVQPATLVFVGFLAVACAILLAGTALGARMFAVLRHAR